MGSHIVTYALILLVKDLCEHSVFSRSFYGKNQFKILKYRIFLKQDFPFFSVRGPMHIHKRMSPPVGPRQAAILFSLFFPSSLVIILGKHVHAWCIFQAIGTGLEPWLSCASGFRSTAPSCCAGGLAQVLFLRSISVLQMRNMSV